jgi:hypothetical protein
MSSTRGAVKRVWSLSTKCFIELMVSNLCKLLSLVLDQLVLTVVANSPSPELLFMATTPGTESEDARSLWNSGLT